MNKITLNYLILNNFRNIEYNDVINKDLSVTEIIKNNPKWFYNFEGENISLFDWENWYWKTTFFMALEFLFLWDNLDKEKIISDNNLKSEKNWDSKQKDYCRNSKDDNKEEYFVRWIFKNWKETFDIVRSVSKDNEIENNNILINWKISNQESLNKIFFKDWLTFAEQYKNFFYLPQDNVFEFLLNWKRWDSISSLLNLSKEEDLLKNIKKWWTWADNNSLIWNIRKIKSNLSEEKTNIQNKNTLLKKELEKNTKVVDLAEYKKISILEKEISITNFDNDNPKITISQIQTLITNLDDILYLKNNFLYFKYKNLQIKIEKIEWLKDFIIWEQFDDYLYYSKSKNTPDYKYKDILKDIENLNFNKRLLVELNNELKQLIENPSIEKITTLSVENYNKYSGLIDLSIFKNFITEIKKEIKDFSDDIKKYDWLKKNVEYIFWNVEKDSFKNIIIYSKDWIEKKEKFCPACWSSFDSYEKLKVAIKEQLDYFLLKTKDTEKIDLKISSFLKSEYFINLTKDLLTKIDQFDKEISNKNIIYIRIQWFEKYIIKQELNDFINENDHLFFQEKNNENIYNEYHLKLISSLPKIKLDEVNLDIIQMNFENKFYNLFNTKNIEKILTSNIEKIDDNIISNNKKILLDYKENLQIILNQEDYINNQNKERYLDKRINILNNYEKLFTELHSKLDQWIKKYKKDIVSIIKIPVYIFSKRILKNYEWDWIILVYNEKDKKIKIQSTKYEKNPIFNYSQWQLTAVMISILLSLNIFISNKSNLNILLIDDPIQTLDDLNQLAFINLLRYQFSNKQIIISTHEQEFSNLIRYKFWRLWMKEKNFNVKDNFLG